MLDSYNRERSSLSCDCRFSIASNWAPRLWCWYEAWRQFGFDGAL